MLIQSSFVSIQECLFKDNTGISVIAGQDQCVLNFTVAHDLIANRIVTAAAGFNAAATGFKPGQTAGRLKARRAAAVQNQFGSVAAGFAVVVIAVERIHQSGLSRLNYRTGHRHRADKNRRRHGRGR